MKCSDYLTFTLVRQSAVTLCRRNELTLALKKEYFLEAQRNPRLRSDYR